FCRILFSCFLSRLCFLFLPLSLPFVLFSAIMMSPDGDEVTAAALLSVGEGWSGTVGMAVGNGRITIGPVVGGITLGSGVGDVRVGPGVSGITLGSGVRDV